MFNFNHPFKKFQRRQLSTDAHEKLASNVKSIGETTIESTTTIDEKGQKTTLYKQITNMKHTWSNLSPMTRRFVYGYLAVGAIDMFYQTYNSGTSELLSFRQKPNHHKNEWEAVKYGCSKDSGERFFSSLFWPTSIYSNIMPHIILRLNPPPTQSISKEK